MSGKGIECRWMLRGHATKDPLAVGSDLPGWHTARVGGWVPEQPGQAQGRSTTLGPGRWLRLPFD